MNPRVLMQAIYVTQQGRMYKSKPKPVAEGQERFDFENELKFQLAMTDYVIEFENEHGHRQFIQPKDLETIIAVPLGYEPVQRVPQGIDQQEVPTATGPANWSEEEKAMVRNAIRFSAPERHSSSESTGFSTKLPVPDRPVQKVRVKPVDSDNEATQEIVLPFAAIDTVRRVIGAQDHPHGPTRMAACETVRVKLAAGTASPAPTP